jgi:predicted N-acetyltransferase YhbS
MADMLVKLYDIDYTPNAALREQGIVIKKAFPGDKAAILDFVRENFPGSPAWVHECEYALSQNPPACHIAVLNKQVVGFACYDASAKGFFGPTGVREDYRMKGIGRELLLRSLWSMRESGYAYAIIGWAAPTAAKFYKESAGAVEIPDSPPEKSIYSNLVRMG